MDQGPVECPDCKAEIGQCVNVEGMYFLRVGVLLIRDTQGICMSCGRVFYWSISQKVIAQVVKAAMLK